METLPYRDGVGIMLLDGSGRIWAGERSNTHMFLPGSPAWQMPQGGIDAGETPEAAAFRELREETGTGKARLLARSPSPLFYDLPEALVGRVLQGYRGQRQHWFAMRFEGSDEDFDLLAHSPAEFRRWRWFAPEALIAHTVAFKRSLYEDLMDIFSEFLMSP